MKIQDILTEATASDYDTIATDDFQGRNGETPSRPNIPDTIKVDSWTEGVNMIFSFYNTRQAAAENWTTNYLTTQNLPYDSITATQSGDHDDDWVEVTASVEFT